MKKFIEQEAKEKADEIQVKASCLTRPQTISLDRRSNAMVVKTMFLLPCNIKKTCWACWLAKQAYNRLLRTFASVGRVASSDTATVEYVL